MAIRREFTGWVKLHRKYLKNSIWNDDPANRVFLWLLMTAEHKAKIERVGRREIPLNRGQLVTSQGEMGNATGLSRKQLRIILARLERDQTITCQANRKHTLITVVNYAFYQGDDGEEGGFLGRFSGQGPNKGPNPGPSKTRKKRRVEYAGNLFDYPNLSGRGELAGTSGEGEKGPNTGPEKGPALYKEEEVKEDLRKPPPNPPPAGGRDFSFSESEQTVLKLWSECRVEAGQSYFEDKGTVRGAKRMAAFWLDTGKVTTEQIRQAMRNFILEVMTNPKARLFDLSTLAGSLSKYLDAAAMKKSVTADKKVLWRWRCDRCGLEACGQVPVSKGTPATYPCNSAQKRDCGGTMQPVQEGLP